jgi:hypothetical protein
MLRDRNRSICRLQNRHNPGTHENRQLLLRVESTECIAREKRDVDLPDSIRPLSASPVLRKENIIAPLL